MTLDGKMATLDNTDQSIRQQPHSNISAYFYR